MVSELKDRVIDYFRGVDTQDIQLILSTLTSDCYFAVETHGVSMHGSKAISQMFERLWANHQWVKHDQFEWVICKSEEAIAVRFQVTNKLLDGQLVHKSNCNFFNCTQGLFSEVRVYMAGKNTLDQNH
ncbi:MAG: hypothetical protein CMM80_00465 [Rhodospirillaceae bacterium]|nr:hypothetical protein [Rhodospirillaceae bacterium]